MNLHQLSLYDMFFRLCRAELEPASRKEEGAAGRTFDEIRRLYEKYEADGILLTRTKSHKTKMDRLKDWCGACAGRIRVDTKKDYGWIQSNVWHARSIPLGMVADPYPFPAPEPRPVEYIPPEKRASVPPDYEFLLRAARRLQKECQGPYDPAKVWADWRTAASLGRTCLGIPRVGDMRQHLAALEERILEAQKHHKLSSIKLPGGDA